MIIAAVTASMMLVSSGCTMQRKDGKKVIGISMPSKSIERWDRDGEYLKQKFEEEGYIVELRYSDNNADMQVNDLQVLIADDVDLLIVVANDGNTLFRTLEDAKIKNIPVLAYDRLIMNTDAVSYYISFDNYQVGVLQAQYIVDELKLDTTEEKHNIELVSGDPADNNATYFYNGALDTLRPYLDTGELTIVSGKEEFLESSTPGWSTDKAFENMQNTLASYYSDGTVLEAVLCATDKLSVGVTQAIQSDYKGELPIITGQDGDVAVLKNIVDGLQSMTIYKNVSDEADVTVDVAKAILDGKTIDKSLIASFSVPCTFDTESYHNGIQLIPSYLLKPEIITAENIGSLVDTGLYRWDDEHKYLIAD